MKLVLLFVLSLFIVSANAEKLKVGEGREFTTIQEAVDQAVSGDRICIYPGEYNEILRVYNKTNLRIETKGSGDHFIDAVVLVLCEEVELKDFECGRLSIASSEEIEVKDIDVSFTQRLNEDPAYVYGLYGINMVYNKDVVVDDCNVEGAFINGILINKSEKINVGDCDIKDSLYFGIRLCDSEKVSLNDNDIDVPNTEIAINCGNEGEDD